MADLAVNNGSLSGITSTPTGVWSAISPSEFNCSTRLEVATRNVVVRFFIPWRKAPQGISRVRRFIPSKGAKNKIKKQALQAYK